MAGYRWKPDMLVCDSLQDDLSASESPESNKRTPSPPSAESNVQESRPHPHHLQDVMYLKFYYSPPPLATDDPSWRH